MLRKWRNLANLVTLIEPQNSVLFLSLQTGLSVKSQVRLVFRLKNLVHLERGDFLADLLDYVDDEAEDSIKELRFDV